MKISTIYQAYRRKPFVARWYEGQTARNRFFATEAEREAFIAELKAQHAQQDESLGRVPPHKLIRWQQAMQIDPEADPVEVYRYWQKHRKTATGQLRQDRQLEVAGAAYIESMERQSRNASYIKHVERALRDLGEDLGNAIVREVTTDAMRKHLFGLPYRPVTIRNRRNYFVGAFGWWKRQGWLDENPMNNVEAPTIPEKEPGILTVEETRALLQANEFADPKICGLLALGAFAGMRTSAIARTDFEEIDFGQHGILTPAEKTKKKRRQWIEDLPENLWLWLERTPPSAFAMTHRQMLHRRSMALKRAGLLIEADDIARENRKREQRGEPTVKRKPKCPPKNALRHSFVTYHVALHRDPGKTALIVSHRDQNCLYRHYLGITTKAAAKEYFQIKPTKQ